MAKSPNSGQSLVAVHSGTAPKHAVLFLGGNENLVSVPVMSDCSTAGDKPKPGPVTRRSSKLDGNKPFFQNLFLPRYSDYTASPQRLEKEKKKSQPGSTRGNRTGVTA
ncbi:hypothetical protein Scep_031086 [Stephania cephalantha]|uniref:Uncharacterized protein n=1 Tax=Stephania cephalantha TaxID=152367 RepID=A0AAP0DU59_9MAGN